MITLYSYLLQEKAVREPSKKYLMIATVTDSSNFSKGQGASGAHGVENDIKKLQ